MRKLRTRRRAANTGWRGRLSGRTVAKAAVLLCGSKSRSGSLGFAPMRNAALVIG